MERVVVTGASGFVGTYLVNKLLEEGMTVYAVVRDCSKARFQTENDKLRLITCDMQNVQQLVEVLRDEQPDTFYHLAWSGSTGADRANYRMQLQNVEFACEALKVAEELGCSKFLCAGTITEQIVDTTVEKGLGSPNLIYGIAKKTTKEILQTMATAMNIEVIWMQFSNVFGGNNNTGNLISYTFNQLRAGKEPEYSSACQPYDFLYIEDLIQGLYLLGSHSLQHKEYFLGSGSPRILKEYLCQIPEILGMDIPVGIGKRQDDGVVYEKEWFSTEKLYSDTGYQAQYSFEDAIKISYYGE